MWKMEIIILKDIIYQNNKNITKLTSGDDVDENRTTGY